jgi:hypothetical protein
MGKGYIVLGMHRSGTSCLTGLLETTGLWAGEVNRRAKHNRKGNLENEKVRFLNDHILNQFNGSWDNPPKRIELDKIDPEAIRSLLESFRGRGKWLLKDPRLLLTWEAWLPLLPDHQIIGVFRHPFSTACSLNVRSFQLATIKKGVRLWSHYNRRLIALHKKHNFPLLQFDLKREDYLRQFRSLCQRLGLTFNLREASKFYDQDLIHHSHRESIEWDAKVKRMYDYLISHSIEMSRKL